MHRLEEQVGGRLRCRWPVCPLCWAVKINRPSAANGSISFRVNVKIPSGPVVVAGGPFGSLGSDLDLRPDHRVIGHIQHLPLQPAGRPVMAPNRKPIDRWLVGP